MSLPETGNHLHDKCSWWLSKAAGALDCAVQLCGTEDSDEISKIEARLDELSAKLKEAGN